MVIVLFFLFSGHCMELKQQQRRQLLRQLNQLQEELDEKFMLSSSDKNGGQNVEEGNIIMYCLKSKSSS